MSKLNVPDYSSSNEERMNRFFDVVNSQVSDETDRIIAQGNAERDRILKEANAQAAKLAYDDIEQNSKKSSGKYGLIVNKSELDKKKEVLRYRSELVDSIFDNIRIKLAEFRNSEKYLPYLTKIIENVPLEKGAVIHLGSADMQYADALKKSIKTDVTFFEDKLIRLGGISVYYPEKSVIDDKTIDTSFSEQRKKFASSGKFSIPD